MHFKKRTLKKFTSILLLWIFVLQLLAIPTYAVTTTNNRSAIIYGRPYYDPGATCSPSTSSTPQPNTGKSIYILGDSLTAGMQSRLQTELTNVGYIPTINGQPSRPLYYSTGGRSGDIIDGFTAVDNDQATVRAASTIVIGLGTNRQGGGDDEYRQKVGEMIDKVRGLAPTARIFWTNMAGSGSKNVYASYNQILEDLKTSKNFQVIDWASNSNGALPANEVHPTAAGYDTLASTVVSAVGSPVAPTTTTSLSGNCSCSSSSSSSGGTGPSGGTPSERLASFVDLYGQMAYDNSITTAVPYDFTLAQAVIESGYGQSGLTRQANNFFGIKAGSSWTGETITMPTREVINGQSVTVNAAFRKYPTAQDGFADHDRFLRENERYRPAFQYSNDPYQFLAEVKRAGYATDPDYVTSVGNVIRLVQAYVASKGTWPPSSQVVYSAPPLDSGGGPSGGGSSSGTNNCTPPAGNANIIQKISLPSSSTITPTAIVLHWWGGSGGIDSLIGTLQGRALSVQIGTTADGKVYQLTPQLNSLAAHAKCANSWAIGNEIEGGASFGPDPLGSGQTVALDLANNQAQFEAVVAVTMELMRQYNIPLDGPLASDGSSGVGVHSHKEVDANCSNPSGKADVDDVYLRRVKDEIAKRMGSSS